MICRERNTVRREKRERIRREKHKLVTRKGYLVFYNDENVYIKIQFLLESGIIKSEQSFNFPRFFAFVYIC